MVTESAFAGQKLSIPEYAFWQADGPEQAFGARAQNYLDITKGEAAAICAALPVETEAANELFATGAIVRSHLPGGLNEGLTPEGVRGTIGALLRSFGPSHEVKIATVAVALHRWFSRSPATLTEGAAA